MNMKKKFYVVPSNEYDDGDDCQLKELRVSVDEYDEWVDGPISGVIRDNQPIEHCEFDSIEDARAAIIESAPHLQA